MTLQTNLLFHNMQSASYFETSNLHLSAAMHDFAWLAALTVASVIYSASVASKIECHLHSFDFSNRRFIQVLSHELFQNSPRDLDLVELWSGVQSLVNAARLRKLSAEPFDIDRDPPRTANEEDILSFGLSARYNSNPLLCFQ